MAARQGDRDPAPGPSPGNIQSTLYVTTSIFSVLILFVGGQRIDYYVVMLFIIINILFAVGPEAAAPSVPAALRLTRLSREAEATRDPARPQSPSPDPGLVDDLKKVKKIFEQNNVIQSTRQFFKKID